MNRDCWYRDICTNNCSEGCIRYKLMYSLFNLSMLPKAQWKYKKLDCLDSDYDAFIQLKNMQDNMESFVNEGRQLYIHSANCGNGKTSWSIRLMYGYFNSIWHKSSFNCKALFISTQKFLFNCKRAISQNVEGFDELCNLITDVDLIIWDDLPCGKFTDYENQILFQYIDDRICSSKANIFTGNANRLECEKLIGNKMTSRIFSDYVIEFVEEDKRGW